jgi:hypothetical protein
MSGLSLYNSFQWFSCWCTNTGVCGKHSQAHIAVLQLHRLVPIMHWLHMCASSAEHEVMQHPRTHRRPSKHIKFPAG